MPDAPAPHPDPPGLGSLDPRTHPAVTGELMAEVRDAVARLVAPLPMAPPGPAAQDTEPADIDSLYRLVTRGTWRRSRVDEDTSADIRSKLTSASAAGAPIEFSDPFGCYKAWYQPSAPHIDWAEVMWVSYLREFAASIARAYPPGVVVTLSYHSQAIDLIDNIPLADQATYADELARLAAAMSGNGVTVRLVDLVDQHGGPAAFRSQFVEHLATSDVQPTPAAVASAGRNLNPVGIPPQEWHARVWQAARACAVMEAMPQRRAYNKLSHRIQISHVRGPKLVLHLGTTRTSIHQPWVGTGFFARTSRGGLIETIAGRSSGAVWVPVAHQLDHLSPALAKVAVQPPVA